MFAFDFPGCGLSEGEFISLGWHEREEVNIIIDYLRKERCVSTIGLWGRSMGAVTALLHGDRDPSIAALILDSPFSNLEMLVKEIAYKKTMIPGFLVGSALSIVNESVKSRADFDIYNLNPL